MKNLKVKHRSRVDGIRAQTSMRIEALESALIETKLQLNRERERAEMQLADMESKTINDFLSIKSEEIQRLANVEDILKDP